MSFSFEVACAIYTSTFQNLENDSLVFKYMPTFVCPRKLKISSGNITQIFQVILLIMDQLKWHNNDRFDANLGVVLLFGDRHLSQSERKSRSCFPVFQPVPNIHTSAEQECSPAVHTHIWNKCLYC